MGLIPGMLVAAVPWPLLPSVSVTVSEVCQLLSEPLLAVNLLH